MWVADMEFAVAPEILQAITDRVDRRILGYTLVYDKGYYEALLAPGARAVTAGPSPRSS